MDESGADAAGAGHNALSLAGMPGLDLLQIRKVPCLGLHVGVRDLVAGDRFLATNFTLSCHELSPIDAWVLSRWGKKVNRNQELGKAGEEAAVNYLKKQGFQILERNFRTRFGEIDIIATRAKEYYFVEVKTRKTLDHGHPLESFPFYRIQRLKKMTLFYAQRHKILDEKLHLSLLGIDCSQAQPQIFFLKDILE